MSEHFSAKVLKEQDGKKVPVTLENGGPVIGEAVLQYNSITGDLEAQFRIDDPKVVEFLREDPISVIFKKEN